MGGFKPHAHPDLYPRREDKSNLVQMLQDNNLEMPSYAADLWSLSFPKGNPEVVKEYKRFFQPSVNFCTDCEIPCIRVDTVTDTLPSSDLDPEVT